MEFKDKLKALRTDRKVTQLELANAIFVSRSAVAKWENGLGLPSDASMNALADYFGVAKSYFNADEPDSIIVEKNQQINRLSRFLNAIWISIFLLILGIGLLLQLGYRFTSASAVHEYYHKYPVIRTADYDFYMNDNEFPTGFEAVQKIACLFKNVDGTWKCLDTADGDHVGYLYCFAGKETDHYFICYTSYITGGGYDAEGRPYAVVESNYRTDRIVLNGEQIYLDFYCYFSSDEPIEMLQIKGETILITDNTFQ